jgi:Tfp pilus assembly protein PilF/TolB-like protein
VWLRFLRRILAFLLLPGLSFAVAQELPRATVQTLVVLPFENVSDAPGIEWIGESFPEVIGQRLASPSLYVVPRQDRLYAFDRAGVPANLHLSRATLFRIAEQMDADYAVLGEYDFDGRTFTAKAQLLDMKRLHLSPLQVESGPLLNLIEIQSALAWDLLRLTQPALLTSKQQFLAASPAIRLDAFENYVRGVTASSRALRLKHFREAVRLNPSYTRAILELARAYYDGRDYEQAASWFARIPKTDPLAREASFYLGLSAYYLNDFARAQDAFTFLASRLPLTEVYNNLGVVAGRRGQAAALDYFRKAVNIDPNDPDYRFNLGLTLYKAGDMAAAARQLREAVVLRPDDSEAKTLLDSIAPAAAARLNAADTRPSATVRLPRERVKRNYDETSFQQLALEIQNTSEIRLSKTDPHTHAAFHVGRGRDLLEQGFVGEAEKQFREAVLLDPTNSSAHSGLARVLEYDNDAPGARAEAQSALRLGPSTEAYLVLARLDLKDNQPSAAAENIERALALEPDNATALALKRTVAARLAQPPSAQ